MERLSNGVNLLVTAVIGSIIPAVITAVTAWWNRDTARHQHETERLRAQRDQDERGPEPLT
jgi:hypothetical protein